MKISDQIRMAATDERMVQWVKNTWTFLAGGGALRGPISSHRKKFTKQLRKQFRINPQKANEIFDLAAREIP